MAVENKGSTQEGVEENYDRKSELRAFDETNAGVKGLVDAGVTCVPRIFFHTPVRTANDPSNRKKPLNFPALIDLDGIEEDSVRRKQVVENIADASGSWGFFQVINHGVADSIMQEMINGTRRFFKQDVEVKKQWYTRDDKRKFAHQSNFDLYTSPAANWRDSFYCFIAPNPPKPQELPEACRSQYEVQNYCTTSTANLILPGYYWADTSSTMMSRFYWTEAVTTLLASN